jgi:hypothetical protein
LRFTAVAVTIPRMVGTDTEILTTRLTELKTVLESLESESHVSRQKFDQIRREIDDIYAKLRALRK